MHQTLDEETRATFLESWPKKCACGKHISEEEWETLHYVGIQTVPPEYGLPELELRNCTCGSTIAIVVPNDFDDS